MRQSQTILNKVLGEKLRVCKSAAQYINKRQRPICMPIRRVTVLWRNEGERGVLLDAERKVSGEKKVRSNYCGSRKKRDKVVMYDERKTTCVDAVASINSGPDYGVRSPAFSAATSFSPVI